MPLRSGKSNSDISYNIEELLDAFKTKNKIGKVHPKSMKKARSIAAAIAYKKAGRSGR